jgi:DNA polymerase-1
MAVIKPKRKTVIKRGSSYTYDPKTFKKEHWIDNFKLVDDPDEIIRALDNAEIFAFDSETYSTGIDIKKLPKGVVRRWIGSGKKARPQDYPFLMSFCYGDTAYSIYDTAENGFKKFKRLGKELLEDKTREKIIHNAKFDMHIAENIGIKLQGKIHDTIVLAKLVNENRGSFRLMKLAEQYDEGIIKFEYMVDAYKKKYKIGDYRKIPKDLIVMYANADVWNAQLIYNKEYPKIIDDNLINLYNQELELIYPLYEMERIGMYTDEAYLLKQDVLMQEEVNTAEQKIYDEAGTYFNINSGKQLYRTLLDLGVDDRIIKKTDKGNPKTSKKELERLATKHNVKLVQYILDYRAVHKLHNTYIEGILAQRDAEGKVHGSINQTEATTGRMSITKPALQTLPKDDTRIRKAFVPSSDEYGLYFMDLDQVEYRLFAHYAKAEELIKSIKKGWDIHRATAAILFSVPYDEVTDEQRSKAKTMNFALIYGMGINALAGNLKCIVSEAHDFRNRYFAQIPEAEPFISQVQRVCRTRGYIRNFYGRRRRLKYNEVYKAVNALIQGCAADYIKSKIIKIYRFLKYNNYKTRMINVVHDEIVFEVHKDELHILPKLRWLLSDFETFRVPITAGVDKGNPSWGQKQKDVPIDFEKLTDEELKLISKSIIPHREAPFDKEIS